MKLARRFLLLFLVLALILSVFTLNSCKPVTPAPTDPDHSDNSDIPDSSDSLGNSDVPENEPPVDLIMQTEAKNPAELDAKFYDASNWTYMTNHNGASRAGGALPVSLDDGSIKFHFANQAIEIGEHTNKTLSFMLKGTNDWEIWFNSGGIDNQTSSAYRLKCVDGEVIFTLSSFPNVAVASVAADLYNKAEWNRFDVSFFEVDGCICIEIYINGKLATLNADDDLPDELSVSGDVIIHD